MRQDTDQLLPSFHFVLFQNRTDVLQAESVNVLTEAQIDARWDIVNNMEFCQYRDDLTYDTFAAMHVVEAKVPDELIVSASEWADTAIVTLSRFSAEGVDRRPQGGDYYLSDLEKELIDRLSELFAKVIVVINSGATIDCEYIAENHKVQGILFGWQGGMEGGGAAADILLGHVNPSGKLTETWPITYNDVISRDTFGKKNTEAHMQNRKLIADWCYEKGLADNVIEKKVRDGKTYFIVNDHEALRGLFGELLAEVQRIKSEGDYEAGKALVETYAVNIDPELHKEVLERYASLGLKPYGGFINPEIVPVEKNGKVVDYDLVYNDNYLEQMLEYGKKYSTL